MLKGSRGKIDLYKLMKNYSNNSKRAEVAQPG